MIVDTARRCIAETFKKESIMENEQITENYKTHFTLAEVLASYKESSDVTKELQEKLAGVNREYDYDVVNDSEGFFDEELEFLVKKYGISEAAAATLEMGLMLFAVKKTGDGLMGEMSKLTLNLEKFKNAVASGLDVEKTVAEVVKECGLENI